ncbi:hypothetical protein PZ892_11305 [Sphingobacterium sp. WM]|uniref:hypothetical protein n=1 Tax=Sphingobacterium sp. WM TaxID=3031802 RepID=UPI00240D3C44|nr:hypothetical protein [Sphingobacterium sp. WM]WFB62266.1 hypothetical protein PZ892_11305 [Sphingobacterium sp. WM]
METIHGREYSDTRFNEELQETEYYIVDWDEWKTEEEVEEQNEEENYWLNDYPNEIDDERIDED